MVQQHRPVNPLSQPGFVEMTRPRRIRSQRCYVARLMSALVRPFRDRLLSCSQWSKLKILNIKPL